MQQRDVQQRDNPPVLAKPATVITIVVVTVAIVALTMAKAFIEVGDLWDAEAHQRRSLDPIPFNGFVQASTWWAPWTNLLGNVLLFVPVGILAVFAWEVFAQRRDARSRNLLRAGLVGFLASLAIEVLQYVFAVGYSDVDDLLFNTTGAVIGGWLAGLLKPRGRLVAIAVMLLGCVVVLVPMAAGAVTS